jgi:hypothetical protein
MTRVVMTSAESTECRGQPMAQIHWACSWQVIAAGCGGSFVAAVQSSTWLPLIVAGMVKVAPDRQVHRERATTLQPGLVRTTSVPLRP